MSVLITWIFLMMLSQTWLVCGTSSNDTVHWELKLFNDLMRDYNKNIKPMKKPHSQITVNIVFSLLRIESLYEKDQVLTTFGWMSLGWRDEILLWNPEDYGGLARMVLNGNEIWVPEIAMLNSVDQGTDLTLNTDCRAAIQFTGHVHWVPGFKWRTTCQINLRFFPFDSQICEVQFINWIYGSREVNLTNMYDYVDTTFYIPNPGWELVSTAVGRTDIVLDIVALPKIAFQLKLKRKSTYFMLNLVVPALIMMLMSLLVFCLPAACGEKVSMSITNLLSYSVLLLMMSDITPQSSDTTPYITIIITISMGISALALACTVMVLGIYHHSPRKPVPGKIKALILRGLACLLLMRRSLDKLQDSNNIICSNQIQPDQPNDNANSDKTFDAEKPNGRNDVFENFMLRKMKEQASDREQDNRRDWEAVAHVVDRFFFVIFALAILLMIGVIIRRILGNSDTGHVEGFPYTVR